MSRLPILLVDVSHDFTSRVEALSDWIQLPVGLLWLAAYVRDRFAPADVSVKVLDAWAEPGNLDAVRATLAEVQPKLVGLRALSPTAGQLHAAARVVKEWNPATVVVAGGPYAHASADLIMDDPNVDAVSLGEGELVLAAVVGRLVAGSTDLREIPGLHCRHEGQIVKGPLAVPIEDLDSLPFPDYRDLDLENYLGKHPHTAVGRPYASLVASRGCPYSCIFCHSIFGRQVRLRSPENVARECRQLFDTQGIHDFIVADDAFNVNLPWAKEVFRQIIKLKIGSRIFFSNGLRGDNWDEEFLDLMVEAGVAEVVYAVESASPRLQRLLQKRLDMAAVDRAFVETAKRGIITNGFFMIGFPGESQEELQQTIDFILARIDDIDFPHMSVVRAFAGSRLYDLARELGFDEEFLRHHAAMPYGMQIRVQSEYNFMANELLRNARMQVALKLYSVARMKRVLGRLRRHLDPAEVVMKFANCTGVTSATAQRLVSRYDDGTFEAAAAEAREASRVAG